jgi:hypothetical protein
MLAYVKAIEDEKDKTRKEYHCASCDAVIADSDSLVQINGSDDHSFVNPAGIRCNFLSFAQCVNTISDGILYLEHSWFPGYGWRFLVCAACLRHLGWQYDALSEDCSPSVFFGVLKTAVRVSEADQ